MADAGNGPLGLVAGRHGRPAGPAGLVATVVETPAVASVMALSGTGEAVAAHLAAAHGLMLPSGPRRAVAGSIAALTIAPGHWLLMAESGEGPAFADGLSHALAGIAAVTDQSDAWLVVRLTGPRVREVLAKGVMLDLHPRVFESGAVAATAVAHIDVILWQRDDSPTFEIAVPRSFGGSFGHWLADAAAEFGLDVLQTP